MNRKQCKYIFFLFFAILLIPHSVSAYLDPGTGSMVWQMLVAVMFGIVFTLKIYWLKIKNFLNRKKNQKSHE